MLTRRPTEWYNQLFRLSIFSFILWGCVYACLCPVVASCIIGFGLRQSSPFPMDSDSIPKQQEPEIRILSDSSKIPNPSAKLLSLKSHIAKPTRLKPGAPKLKAASKGPQMLNPYLKGSWDFHGSFKKGSIGIHNKRDL